MYCYHCGKKINEHRIESRHPSIENIDGAGAESRVEYICPRCGESIHAGSNEKELKTLSVAAHAEIQRANNSFSSGMGSLAIGAILLVLGLIFYLLANRPSRGFELDTTCAEFYVFIVLTVIASILLILGSALVSIGIYKRHTYNGVLKDINNHTFVQ